MIIILYNFRLFCIVIINHVHVAMSRSPSVTKGIYVSRCVVYRSCQYCESCFVH